MNDNNSDIWSVALVCSVSADLITYGLQQGVKYVNKCFGFKAVINHRTDIYQSELFAQFQPMTPHSTSNRPTGHNGENESYHYLILFIS